MVDLRSVISRPLSCVGPCRPPPAPGGAVRSASFWMPPSLRRSEKRRESVRQTQRKRARMLAFSWAPSYARWMATRSTLQFRILGPLEVSRESQSLALGSPKQRALLAVLLLHANEPLSRDRLVDEIWGEA